jgi:type II restriction/modification system DNA methylase subunit YeeA
MNKSAIKNFAVTARVKLMESIEQKAYELGITKTETKVPEVYLDGFSINNKFFKPYQMIQRDKLIQKIKNQDFDQVIEEVAYTWFNRFIAIRFMEVNEYLPTGVRVLSSIDKEKVEPDAVIEVLNISEELDLKLDIVYRLQDENNSEELFKYILVKQCNKLGEIMPIMFEQIEDYTELLLPDNLLKEGSVVRDLIEIIDEEDWKEQVEIIGWLYQYYISEKKDEVFADLKINKKISKENIPAATQLFTPKWIVQYMVENSLGKLWLGSHPNEELQNQLRYYLRDIEQKPYVKEQLLKINNKTLSAEEIKIFDPCMGSGHILVYAFDILYKIYKSVGYSERDIPKLILEKNLYGLDIDDRATQLAYFSLIMKARSYNRKLFKDEIKLNLYSIQESNSIAKEAIQYFSKITKNNEFESLVNMYNDAKEFGSILKVNKINFEKLEEQISNLKNYLSEDLFSEQYKETLLACIPNLIMQLRLMTMKYDIVITNPPYLGYKSFNKKISDYLKKHYPNSSNDLYASFIQKCIEYSKNQGYVSMITQHSWMFLSGYTELREAIINNHTIMSMNHLGPRAFEEIGGEVVQTVAFILNKDLIKDFSGSYVRLTGYNTASQKEEQFLKSSNIFTYNQNRYKQIPESPIVYWISEKLKHSFVNGELLGDLGQPMKGLDTCDNEKFVRFWYEVDSNRIGFNIDDNKDTLEHKWFPYAKGGSFRKWYGNNENVVLWENDGQILRNLRDNKGKIKSRPQNTRYYFKKGITWSSISSSKLSMRYMENSIFGGGGSGLFVNNKYFYFLLALLNSKVTFEILNALNPTLNILVGDLKRLPININTNQYDNIESLCIECINISKLDWDSYETSPGFERHPLLTVNEKKENNILIAHNYNKWETEKSTRYSKLKENEEQLNNIFINIYGLEEEITSKVENNDISIFLSDVVKEIKYFISYFVGCLFGRYSLDKNGLVYAGGDFIKSNYKTFEVEDENIIPVTDDEYFKGDIVNRFIDFIRVSFGNDTCEENLDFIADVLTKKANETSRQRIRRYFVKEFYKDHIQLYQKRPIYWLFDSGNNDGFKALIYMHRYDVGTVAKIRTDYLHRLQRKYEAEISRLDLIMESNLSALELTKSKKQKEKLQKQLFECQQYDQIIAHVANRKIEIDLDDGVKVNYEMFQNIEVPQGDGKKPIKANLLAKI